MKDISRLLASLVGVVLGGGVGAGGFYLLFRFYEPIAGMPGVTLGSAIVLVGGGVLGGGYLGLMIITKVQKARRAKARRKREAKRFVSAKKKKR